MQTEVERIKELRKFRIESICVEYEVAKNTNKSVYRLVKSAIEKSKDVFNGIHTITRNTHHELKKREKRRKEEKLQKPPPLSQHQQADTLNPPANSSEISLPPDHFNPIFVPRKNIGGRPKGLTDEAEYATQKAITDLKCILNCPPH